MAIRTVFGTGLMLALALLPQKAEAAGFRGLFDVETRRAELQTPPLADIKAACLAIPIDPQWSDIPVITGLGATQGYGTDRSANEFSWAVMVLAGRSLAGDTLATSQAKEILLKWSADGAFNGTEVVNDAYYALKRTLLPVAVAYTILRPSLKPAEDAQIVGWLDPLIRRVDKIFDGEVDLNNHRDLADSVLMLWGSIAGDDTLYQKGRERFLKVLADARADGSIPLETRRGARALWYTRQALTSMVVMAEVARGHGDDLYGQVIEDNSIWKLFGFLLNGLHNPILVQAYAAQNYRPGPEQDFRIPDLGFLEQRSNGRNYLASIEALLALPQANFTLQRISAAFDKYALGHRPLIDEFTGGNATCFWGVAKP